jgi:HK97 gp10 family phage protein
MARSKSKFPSKNIRATLRIDPRSLEAHNRKLKQLAAVTREEVVKKALLAGGSLILGAANSRAPGPHIIMKIVKGSNLSKSVPNINPEGLYVAVGPDKAHWYYRWKEYGVKAHSVTKRKRTRYQQYLKKQGVRISKARKHRTGEKMKRTTGSTRPAMVFSLDGKLIFARKVRGFPAKPFLRPAADSQGANAIRMIGKVLDQEIKKVARS